MRIRTILLTVPAVLVSCGEGSRTETRREATETAVNHETSPDPLSIRNGTYTGESRSNVVWIYNRARKGNCSGFLIAPDVLVTAAHCAEYAHIASLMVSNNSYLTSNSRFFGVSGMQRHPGLDLAVMRLKGNVIPAANVAVIWGVRPQTLKVGSLVNAVGYGAGANQAGGNESRNYRQIGQMKFFADFTDSQSGAPRLAFQATATNQHVCPGDSGGPFFHGGYVLSTVIGGNSSSCSQASYGTGTRLYSHKQWLRDAFYAVTGGRILAFHEPAPPPPADIRAPYSVSAVFEREKGHMRLRAVDDSTGETGHEWLIEKTSGPQGVDRIVIPVAAVGGRGSVIESFVVLDDKSTFNISLTSHSRGKVPFVSATSAVLVYRHLIWTPDGDLAASKPVVKANADGSISITAIDNSANEWGFRFKVKAEENCVMSPCRMDHVFSIPAADGRGKPIAVTIPAHFFEAGRDARVEITTYFAGDGTSDHPTDVTSEGTDFVVP